MGTRKPKDEKVTKRGISLTNADWARLTILAQRDTDGNRSMVVRRLIRNAK